MNIRSNVGWIRVSASIIAALCAVGSYADINIQMVNVSFGSSYPSFNSASSADTAYQIGQYEITVGQYVEFLNAAAASDPHGLYNEQMGVNGLGGAFILRSGNDGNYSYTAVGGKENQPVRYVSYADGQRFCNWMQNGQGVGSVESGSYEMTQGGQGRSAGAQWVMPTVSEWTIAAYYNPNADSYFAFPNSTDQIPAEPVDGVTSRVMNFGMDPFWNGFDGLYTSVGETLGCSPAGAFDMGGNVEEWTETTTVGQMQICMGGSFASRVDDLAADARSTRDPANEDAGNGFRVVYLVPEPVTPMLMLGGLGLIYLMRRKRRLSA